MAKADKQARVPSVETCDLRKWHKGTILVSRRWKYPMLITGLMDKWVFLKPCNGSLGMVGRYITFPEDVIASFNKDDSVDAECSVNTVK